MRYNSPASCRYLLKCWRFLFCSELCGEYILGDTETAPSGFCAFSGLCPYLSISDLNPLSRSICPLLHVHPLLLLSQSSSFQSKSCYPSSCFLSERLPRSSFCSILPQHIPFLISQSLFLLLSVCLLPLLSCLHRFLSSLVLSVTVFFPPQLLNFHLFPILPHSFP